ncbi:Pyridine nucleotide-disulphide oxidoreductase [Fontibacillus panacisegetis]|uniref:Pyridine nucleotide-disulphide oxidoreductase n=1 Tax=Fontibacillus panacisegetis TaxID=670482 RepID=A0A1G7ILZ0_9BACL|nr:Pyridine nucleotide-disulphide oxidoreductase [Fontibacillus panacisegetis]
MSWQKGPSDNELRVPFPEYSDLNIKYGEVLSLDLHERLIHFTEGPSESGDIHSDVTIWTAGIQSVKIVQDLTVAKDKQGRVVLGGHYQIPDHPEVFVCGDCASLPFAPSAQAAEGQGHQIAHIISSMWHGEEPKLSKKTGFGLMGKTQVTGRVPRLLKSGVLWMSKRHIG